MASGRLIPIACLIFFLLTGGFMGVLFGVLMPEIHDRNTFLPTTCTSESSSVTTQQCSRQECSTGSSTTRSEHCDTIYYDCYLVTILYWYYPDVPNPPKCQAYISKGPYDDYTYALNLMLQTKNGTQTQCWYDPADYSRITVGGPPSLAPGIAGVVIIGFFLTIIVFGFVYCGGKFVVNKAQDSYQDSISSSYESSRTYGSAVEISAPLNPNPKYSLVANTETPGYTNSPPTYQQVTITPPTYQQVTTPSPASNPPPPSYKTATTPPPYNEALNLEGGGGFSEINASTSDALPVTVISDNMVHLSDPQTSSNQAGYGMYYAGNAEQPVVVSAQLEKSDQDP